jgi:hypothetical protein
MARGLQTLAPLLVMLCGGCISGGYSRQQIFSPIAPARITALEPGKTTLDEVLAAFGAPIFVWEWKGDGAALAWGWSDNDRWGFAISVPVADRNATAYSFDKLANDLPWAVLFFGADDVLIEARQGRLSEIRAETAQPRPAPVPEEMP